MTADLLPFDETLCAKCGHGEALMQYCTGVGARTYLGAEGCSMGREHHHRICERCSYRWLEAVWDGEALGATEYPPPPSQEAPAYREFVLDDTHSSFFTAFGLAVRTAYEAGYEVDGAELRLSPWGFYWLGAAIGKKDAEWHAPPKEWVGIFGTVHLTPATTTVLRCRRQGAKVAQS